MDYTRVFSFVLFLEGAPRFPHALGFKPTLPAPSHLTYMARYWYYLSHRQCLIQFLGILSVGYVTFAALKMGSKAWGTVKTLVPRWWPASYEKALLLVLPPTYLASGLLTAYEATNTQRIRIFN
ncbi:hypothetical protein DER46DRAFT_360711 [Fusarium sp. MPI-SDFR-AT-0072]|nr:hypothetical protein DER46DRAFT_360711 [Fusarium sp. MPI-SDFR-AT-0072]